MANENRIILVTGATGQQGGATARALTGRGFKVRALTRKPDSEKARALTAQGAEVVQGDFDNPDSLEHALKGVWGAFAVQNTWEAGVEREEEQGKRFAQLARKAGVAHFVYSSVASAQRNTGIPHFDNKWRVEETVRAAGFPSYTILRPVFFMDNFASPWFLPGLQEGKLMIGIRPDTVLQMIAVSDIGQYALRAFTHQPEMKGLEIDIAGGQHTMPEAAAILGKAMRRDVRFVQTPIEEVRKWSADYAAMFEWFDRVGYNADIAGLPKRFGVRPTTLPEWAAGVRWSQQAA